VKNYLGELVAMANRTVRHRPVAKFTSVWWLGGTP